MHVNDLVENIDDHRNELMIDHSLDLRRVASRDVRDGPRRLLHDARLRVMQQSGELWQRIRVDDVLKQE